MGAVVKRMCQCPATIILCSIGEHLSSGQECWACCRIRRYVYGPDWEAGAERHIPRFPKLAHLCRFGCEIKPGKLVSKKGTWLKSTSSCTWLKSRGREAQRQLPLSRTARFSWELAEVQTSGPAQKLWFLSAKRTVPMCAQDRGEKMYLPAGVAASDSSRAWICPVLAEFCAAT